MDVDHKGTEDRKGLPYYIRDTGYGLSELAYSIELMGDAEFAYEVVGTR